MSENGVKTTTVPVATLLDDVLGNKDGTTSRMSVKDLSTQLAGTGAISDELNKLLLQITSSGLLAQTWAGLATLTGEGWNSGAEVIDTDAGTHQQATATGYDGDVVANGGRYTWNFAWQRWVRVGDTLAGSLGSAAAAEISDFATAEQGDKADTATQPGDLSAVAFSGSIDDVIETAAKKVLTATERTKLAGVATGATANATDAQLRARSSHTGTQAISTVSGLSEALTAKADLVDGLIPSAQLPGFVDDVIEVATLTGLPVSGETGKIYVTLDTNRQYRWGGTQYSELSASLSLGETANAAYPGDKGKTAFDHTSLTDNPHGVTPAQIGAATEAQGAKADAAVQPGALSAVATSGSVADLSESADKKVLTAAERTKLAGVATGATANATDAQLRARSSHTGTQAADTITETASIKLLTATERTKLAGVTAGATANATDAQLRARSSHTGTQPISSVAELQAALDLKAGLEGGTIPLSLLPDAVLGSVRYQGTWDAATNTPAIPAASSANKGYYYRVVVPGSTLIDGKTDWKVPDWLVSNGTVWEKIDNSEIVTEVNGKTGAITLVKADIGLGNVPNLSADDLPLSLAATKALDGTTWTHLDGSVSSAFTVAERIYEGENTGGIRYALASPKFGTPLGELQAETLTVREMGPNRILYIDPAQTFAPEISVQDRVYSLVETAASANATKLHRDGTWIITLQSDTGRIGGLLGPSFTRKADLDAALAEVTALAAVSYNTDMQASNLSAMLHALAKPSWNRGLPFEQIDAGNGWYQIQPEADHVKIEITNTNTVADLEYLPHGASVTIRAAVAGCRVFLHADPVGITGNRAELGLDDMIKVTQAGTREAPKFYVDVIAGAPVWIDQSRPAMQRSFIGAGQSNISLAFKQGFIGGFNRRLFERFQTGHDSLYFGNGATGGSPITGSTGWWNSVVPGDALANCLSVMDAMVAAGHPDAGWMIWNHGEDSINQMDAGDLTPAENKAAIRSVFEYIRAYDNGRYADLQFLVSGPQAQDDEGQFLAAMAARTAYIELVEELDYVHPACGWYDVPRPFGDAPEGVHPLNSGYYASGYRAGEAYLQALDAITNDTAPLDTAPYIYSVEDVVLGDDGLYVAELEMRCEVNNIYVPEARQGRGQDLGPFPFEFCAVAGDVFTNAPMALVKGTAIALDTNRVQVKLYSQTNLAGARIYTFNGNSPYARRNQFLRNDKRHGPMLGMPARDQRTAVLT